jgi:RNA polymerase sigma factor (sigma-70 family)
MKRPPTPFRRHWYASGASSAAEPPSIRRWHGRTALAIAWQCSTTDGQLSRLLPRLAPPKTEYAGPESSDRVTVWGAVDNLPPRQRHVVYLHYAVDLPFEEIARIVGISPSAARTHASRGLATLRSQLSTEEVSG